ncbi:hypothetical protein Pmani_015786 [Petrolisthes manimaculis]|uniref:Methionine--tRNA ligase, cytoplasmic n=1 Tax=Petrolisthes manimaculis TaxID=1843537 RepID=A0AAE1PTM2_9EUCA|nr:hypothetical protein Pmani_015786 [Petrolisthes manimaculis]
MGVVVGRKGHTDALKILLAAALSKKNIEFVENNVFPFGAVLEVTDQNTSFRLPANSAVLYLLQSPGQIQDPEVEKWLEWEATELQPVLVPYLVSLAGGRKDKTLEETLCSLLTKLSSSGILTSKEVTAATVVMFSALHPLTCEAAGSFLKTQHSHILQFLTTLGEVTHFKNIVTSWKSESGLLKTLENTTSQPWNPIHNTMALLKVSDVSPSHAAISPEQNKPVRAAVTEAQLKAAQVSWKQSVSSITLPKVVAHPSLPVKGETNILITSALPYVNNVPHLGNIIGCVLSADCFARFARLRGDNVLYVCGTDEYGTATETKAIAEGLTPQQICDKYHNIHSNVYKWFNISFNDFGRTTTEQQTKVTHEIYHDLENNGLITEDAVEQQYCEKCKRFLADRFVEGGCPHPGCGYPDARGDQCDGCSKLVNAMELVEPRCKLCSSTPIIRSSTHLFLNLPLIEPKLKAWLATSSPQWTSNAQVICESWLRDGLKSRCITRDLKWGTPVPKEGFEDKVFYVWFDAPIGYISITAGYTDQWKQWWQNPEQIQYYEFMAKDNVPFHSVVFPSCQLGTDKPWTKVTHLVATEYLNYEDGKFSKSRGVGVFGDQVMETGIPSDVWRFYLLYVRPEAQDTSFSWVDLQTKNNSELLNNLGNFIHRALSFVFKFFNGKIPEDKLNRSDYQVVAAVNQELSHYTTALANNHQRDGLRTVLAITRLGNQYIQENEPYKLVKPGRSVEEQERGATVTAVAANIVALVSIILEPYMPDTTVRIKDLLGDLPCLHQLPRSFNRFLPPGHVIKEPHPLIKPIEDDLIQRLSSQFGGQQPNPQKKPVDPVEITQLQSKVEEQANNVRKLKEGGTAGKEKIADEVKVLLKLKAELAAVQGVDPSVGGKDKKKAKKGGGGGKGKENASKMDATSASPAATPASSLPVNEEEANRLQAQVTQQGDKVRAVKTRGNASKEEVNAEVAILLDLKKQLAVAQGLDPNTLTGKEKKKKK